LWLTTKHAKTQGGVAGTDYFALRKSTTQLHIPRRLIFGPVFNKIQPKAMPFFEAKFHEAIARYQTGGTKK
jgi:hypothetical protein